MRHIAVLLLLLQLQPVVGSVLCLHDAELGRAECTMPQAQRPAGAVIGMPDTDAAAGCAGMAYCAPSAPAVPIPVDHLALTAYIHPTPLLSPPPLPSGEPSAPPFHPPRA